ncbi:acyltransferase [Akkermansiaceae bacterium]|nr:acyltransferase [Akkermansiaceae bacterium]
MNSAYIRGIDGIRALAVLAVVLFHLDPEWLKGGFSGVDVFFVISGYVVALSLYKHREQKLGGYLLEFFKRRVLRLMPALLVCLCVTSALTMLFIPDSWLSTATPSTAYLAFFGFGNVAQVIFNDGYFAPRSEFNPFTHTWSLGVEEQFYLLLPAVFYFCSRREFSSVLSKFLFPALCLISLGICYYQTQHSSIQAFYLLPSRLWELATGVLLFQMNLKTTIRASRIDRIRPLLLNISLWAGLVGLLGSFLFITTENFPFPSALVPVFSTCLVIQGLVGQSSSSLVKKILEHVSLVFLGKISYSLYLWHWPVIVLLKWTAGIESLETKLIALVASFLLALASYYLLECKVSRSAILKSWNSRKLLAIAVIVIISSFLATYALFHNQKSWSLSVVSRNSADWYPTFFEATPPKSDALAEKTVFLFGDSHAFAYHPMVQKTAEMHGSKVITLSAGGRSVVDLLRPGLCENGDFTSVFKPKLEELLHLSNPGDIVFLASLRMHRFSNPWAEVDQNELYQLQVGEYADIQRKQALEEARKVIHTLQSAGLTVLIDAPKPVFKAPAFRVSDWFNQNNPIGKHGLMMDRAELERHRQPVMNSLAVLQSEFPALKVWDPFYILAPEKEVSVLLNGKPTFFDGDHISGYANELLIPHFEKVILSLVE